MRQTKRKQLSRRSVRRPRLRNTIRWILYVLFIFLAFVTANGGDFIKPLLLIPAVHCIRLRNCSLRRHRHSVRSAAGYFLRHTAGLSWDSAVFDLPVHFPAL